MFNKKHIMPSAKCNGHSKITTAVGQPAAIDDAVVETTTAAIADISLTNTTGDAPLASTKNKNTADNGAVPATTTASAASATTSAADEVVVPAYQLPEQASLEDPLCSARTAQAVTFQDVTTASFLIKGGVEYTPCPRSQLSGELGMDIYLKKEFLQYTGR